MEFDVSAIVLYSKIFIGTSVNWNHPGHHFPCPVLSSAKFQPNFEKSCLRHLKSKGSCQLSRWLCACNLCGMLWSRYAECDGWILRVMLRLGLVSVSGLLVGECAGWDDSSARWVCSWLGCSQSEPCSNRAGHSLATDNHVCKKVIAGHILIQMAPFIIWHYLVMASYCIGLWWAFGSKKWP